MEARYIGNYKIADCIGEGTFASVYKGIHIPTGMLVAIKAIDKNGQFATEDHDRLLQEIEVLRKCNYPYIARFYEEIEDQNTIYIVQEYLQEGNLLQYYNMADHVPESKTKKFFIQMLLAVNYLHNSLGVTHRDLKVENVLLDENLNARLIDFGLCSSKSPDSKMLTSCGSPAYIAPEIIHKRGYTKAVDVWALGIILFAMVHVHLPFDDSNIQRLFQKIIYREVDFKKGINPLLRDLLERMLAKAPEERITIPEIMAHPWVRDSMQSFNPSYASSFVEDKNVITMMRIPGINIEQLKIDVKEGKITTDTVSYRIIERYLIKRALGQTMLGSGSVTKMDSDPTLIRSAQLLCKRTIFTKQATVVVPQRNFQRKSIPIVVPTSFRNQK